MKSKFLFLCLLGPIIMYGQTYELIGQVQGLDADTLLLLKVKSEYEFDYIPVKEGSFNYKDTLSEPFFVQLLVIDKATQEANEKLAEFMVEEGVIQINGDTSVYDSITITGSRSDSILKQYFKEDEKLLSEWGMLKLQYDESISKGDTVLKKTLAIQLNGITFKKRVPLLKRYVNDNKGNIVGALLPNFCTLSEVLKKEDYLEMYNFLSKPIQETDYGKSLKARADQ